MKTSFDLKNIVSRLRQNVSLALVIALLILLAGEGLVVRRSVQILLASQHVEVKPKTPSVRVNFGLYSSIADRFSHETSFTPTQVTAKDPFGTIKFAEPKAP